ncbi:MAG: FtsX-like permease family protein [Mogibacterium sp.]|nr:FtsX-like permease family protein [Mogibacterium sp.]
MSMATALRLSLNNLMTKKARTLLTAFAGSIGIIGIALILSVSHGFQRYIDKLEEDTLSSYPLTIQSETADMTSMITAFMANAQDTKGEESGDSIHEQQIMTDLLASVGSNDLAAFKKHVDSNIGEIGDWFNAYDYSYGLTVNIYSTNMEYGPLRVSPGSIMQSYMSGFQQSNFSMMNTDVFFQMMYNEELLKSQYKVLAGKWPEKYDELLLVLDSEDQLNDYIVYTLGLRDPQELKDMINDVMNGKEVENNNEQFEWSYDDFIGMDFALVHSCDTYRQNSSYDVWESMTDDDDFMEDLIKKSEKLHITGIVCAKEVSAANAMSSGIGYLPSLTHHMIDYAKDSDIVKIQRADKKVDVFSGKTFESIRNKNDEGLGFEDMISIDESKLASALGGDMDPNAITDSIKKIGNKAFSKITDQKAIEKITNAVRKDLKSACEGIDSDLIKQAKKKPDSYKLTDDAIDKALGDNLYSKKNSHYAILNGLLKGYASVLKASKGQINDAIDAASPDAVAKQLAEQLSDSGMEISKDQVAALIKAIPKDADEEEAKAVVSSAIPGLPEEQVSALASALLQASQASDVTPADILSQALPNIEEGYTSADEIADGINNYALKMITASNLYPALGEVAKAVGSQFNIDPSGIADAFTMKMDEDELTRLITAYVSGGEETNYERNLRKLGYADIEKPEAMSFYLKDFDSKENFLKFIDDYNQKVQDAGDEDLVISYTDITGVMIKSVKSITNAVSYVLIAFVAISLIVSSIMIGVITYISVLERTKEIGILRAIGASKRDISRIFNAETIIVGLCAGLIGIGASLLLLIPINKVLINLTKIAALKAILPLYGGIALVIISVLLTFIAGLIPSGMAARKDPVVALRTE